MDKLVALKPLHFNLLSTSPDFLLTKTFFPGQSIPSKRSTSIKAVGLLLARLPKGTISLFISHVPNRWCFFFFMGILNLNLFLSD